MVVMGDLSGLVYMGGLSVLGGQVILKDLDDLGGMSGLGDLGDMGGLGGLGGLGDLVLDIKHFQESIK